MNHSDIVGIIFDLDGVLVDSADAHYESWRRLGGELGRTITRPQFHATFGRRNGEIIPEFFGPSSETRIKQLGDRKEVIYRDLIRSDPPIAPGATKLLGDLKSLVTRIAIGSSAPIENIELIVNAAKWAKFFDAIVSAADVTKGKPDPEVFSKSCERLHLPPHRCIVVEDAAVGVQAAKAAGAHCVGIVMHGTREALRGANLVVDRLSDLSAQTLISLASS
jgi:beta-phosphoglucomutase